jgi:hypothetical protein
MDLPKHELLFSRIRLSRYLTACGGDPNKAVSLYKYNIQASQALYPLISVLEIALRNGIDRELVKHFKDNDWLIKQRNQFANHPDMTYKDYRGIIQSDHFFRQVYLFTRSRKNLSKNRPDLIPHFHNSNLMK